MKIISLRRARVFKWAPVAFYMTVIFSVSALSIRLPLFQKAQKIHVDWLAHVVEYTFLGYLLARAIRKPKFFWVVILIGVLYGVSDEIHQASVPARDASVYDAIADTIGVTLGQWLWFRRKQLLVKNA